MGCVLFNLVDFDNFLPSESSVRDSEQMKKAFRYRFLFLENEVNRKYQKYKSNKMVESEGFVFKGDQCEDCEDDQRDDFLQYFELHQTEWAAIALKSDFVCGHLKEILEQRNAPADKHHRHQP